MNLAAVQPLAVTLDVHASTRLPLVDRKVQSRRRPIAAVGFVILPRVLVSLVCRRRWRTSLSGCNVPFVLSDSRLGPGH